MPDLQEVKDELNEQEITDLEYVSLKYHLVNTKILLKRMCKKTDNCVEKDLMWKLIFEIEGYEREMLYMGI